MGTISTTGATALGALALLAAGAASSFAAPGDMARLAYPGALAYKRPWIGEACKQDFSTLCSSLPSNSRRDAIVDCLKQHADALSPSCHEAISDPPKGMGAGASSPHGGHGGRHAAPETPEP